MAQGDKAHLSARFDRAFVYASQLHAAQTRKGSRTPYVAHLMGVAALVLEDGGNEDQAVAALLHDAIEDHPRQGHTEAEIRLLFGERVLRIVLGCTDAFTNPKPPWRKRKVAYLEHLASAPTAVRRVAAADKLHNARAMLHDYRHQGERLWRRFNAGKKDQLWYYRKLVQVLKRGRRASPLVRELERVVGEFESAVSEKRKR
jgi:(p)ppGpp synthase/HD superfamily hydrolase